MEIAQGIYAVGGLNNKTAVFLNKTTDLVHSTFKPAAAGSLIDSKWLPWGDNNLYPQEFADKLKKTNIASAVWRFLRLLTLEPGFDYTREPKRKRPSSLKKG
jgi:hypothetical protein